MATQKVKGTVTCDDGLRTGAVMVVTNVTTGASKVKGLTGSTTSRSGTVEVEDGKYEANFQITASPGADWKASVSVNGTEKDKNDNLKVDNDGAGDFTAKEFTAP